MKYRTIFVSDIHLGTKFTQADKFLDFLKNTESQNLYLVGDIIDGWVIKRKFKWKQSHSNVIQKLLNKAKKGTKIFYIAGNHDDFLRPFLPLSMGTNFIISNEAIYTSLDGEKYFITHGDFFDSITLTKKWIAVLGDKGYDLLLNLNSILNYIRKKIGIKKYWSLSKYIKDNIKKSVIFITNFEDILSDYAFKKGYSGVICGHIHKAEIKKIGPIKYKNCGDWIENCTALVENLDGTWEIINWLDKYDL